MKDPFRKRSRRAGWLRSLAAPLLLALLVSSRAKSAEEYQIKAAFLYNFTRFVDWPPSHAHPDSAPLVIGVLGRDPFKGELEKAIEGRRVNGPAVVSRVVISIEQARAVDMLFVPAGEEGRFAPMTAALREAGVVTVGESDRFAASGGMITFVRQADNLRFQINLGSSEESGVRISAQLLKLATEVRRKS